MEISLLAAVDRNFGLGFRGMMQWQGEVPSDMRRFRLLTLGHTVIMGRKTFVSIGKPLPNRRNIVITHDESGRREGVECFNSIERAITACEEKKDKKVFVIGGGEIYKLFMRRAGRMFITKIDALFEADTYFPHIDPLEWVMVESVQVPVSDKDKYAMEFIAYDRAAK